MFKGVNEYEKFNTNIFIPTNYLKDKVEKLVKNKNNIIGIQVRCVDGFMVTNPNESYKIDYNKTIDKILLKIKIMGENLFNNNYNIFLPRIILIYWIMYIKFLKIR